MGNFYTNHVIVGSSLDEIVDLFQQMGRRAYISPEDNGIVIAYDNDKYFIKSTLKSYNFIKRETEKIDDIEIKIIDWEKYKKYNNDVGDFGDLLKNVKVLPIHVMNYTIFFNKNFI